MTGRFAPSPTGRMHLGNVYCAVMSWLSARRQGGRWLLRIEDLDPQRSRREYAQQLMDDLGWLGLEWDGEPVWQSERTDIYAEYFRLLCERADVYACRSSRADLLSAGAPHGGEARCDVGGREAMGGRVSYRVSAPDEDISFTDIFKGRVTLNLRRDMGDFTVRRSDGVYAYQLAVVVDDGLTGVTEVVRGEDLLTSTVAQLYLYRSLGLTAPRYGHIPLICAADGRRLCKRDKDEDMGHLRSTHSPEQLLGRIGHLAGLTATNEPITLQQLILCFQE